MLPSAAQTEVSLNFSTLPTSQGWEYYQLGYSVPESSVFSVSNNVLTQDTLSTGFVSSGGIIYKLNGVVTPDTPYKLIFHAKLLEEQNNGPQNHEGFTVGAITNGVEYFIGLGNDALQTDYPYSTALDTSVYHWYELDVNPGAQSRVYVDGSFFTSGDAIDYAGQTGSFVWFGKYTGGSNAEVVMDSFEYAQGNTPEPGSKVYASILLVSIGGLIRLRRKSSSRLRQP